MIVAMVVEIELDERPIKFVLEDGSRGRITAKQWVTDGDSVKQVDFLIFTSSVLYNPITTALDFAKPLTQTSRHCPMSAL
jgi:hypothetical protein